MRYEIRDLRFEIRDTEFWRRFESQKRIAQSLLLITCCFLFFSCQKAEEAESNKIAVEVLKIHDEVMPKMDKLQALKAKVKQQTNPKNKAVAEALIQKLDSADNGMMDWMAEYKVELPNKTEADKAAYYAEEKKKIERVKIQMQESMTQAEQFLKGE